MCPTLICNLYYFSKLDLSKFVTTSPQLNTASMFSLLLSDRLTYSLSFCQLFTKILVLLPQLTDELFLLPGGGLSPLIT